MARPTLKEQGQPEQKRKAERAVIAGDIVKIQPEAVFVSRFIGQPALALGDPAVAAAIAGLAPFIERLDFKDEFVAETIGVIVGERRIRSGSDLFRRLTFGRPALGQVIFQAARGRSVDLISAGQFLVNAVRDLVRREKAGDLKPFVPAHVRKLDSDTDIPGMPIKFDKVRLAWERIRPALEGFGAAAKRISF